MTTPSTPAGWYPDPEGTGGQRYWDGFAWTEHRAPAPAPSTAPDESADEFPAGEQETSVESLLEQPTTVVPRETSRPQTPDREDSAPSGAHRAPDAEPEPTQPAAPSFDTPVTPTSEPPSTPSWEVPPTPSWETPPLPSWEMPPLPSWETPPLPPWDTPSTPSDEPPSTPSDEPPSTPSWEAPSAPTDDAPSTPPYGTPSYAASSYDAPQAEAPSAYAGLSGPPAPRGPGGPGGGPDNRKLIIGFLSAVGALLLILVLVLVYAFVIRDDKTTQIAAPGTSTSASRTTPSSEPSETSTESEATESPAPPAGNRATEGDFAFSVASTDSGDTVTSPINEYIEKTANGEFFVVYLNVGNSGSAPLTFLSTLQQLKAGADTFTPDDEASFYLGGGVVTINPGEQVETAVAFDVPVGTTPTSIQVHGEPGGAGVELPV